MSLSTIWNTIVTGIKEYSGIFVIVVIVLMSIIQITPLKINPWSAIGKLFSKLFSKLGRCMMKDSVNQLNKLDSKMGNLSEEIHTDVSTIEKKVNELSMNVDQNEIDRIRWELLDFSNSCQRGINHTQNEFDHIFNINSKYHDILKRAKLTNGQVDREMKYLEDLYQTKKQEDSFLK